MIALPSFITDPHPLRPHLWTADVGLLADAPITHASDSRLNQEERERNWRFEAHAKAMLTHHDSAAEFRSGAE